MKVCFVTHKVKKGDGQGRVNYEVIKETLRRGHEVIIIASEVSNDLTELDQVTWKRVSVNKIPTELFRNQWFALWSTLWLILLGKRIDLTIVNGFITYARSDINCVHFVHSAWLASKYHPFREAKTWGNFYQYLFNWLNSYLERLALLVANKIVVVSEQVKNELVNSAGINEDRISIIRNGVDLQEFYPKAVRRSDLNLLDNRLYALFAGDIKSSRKNLDTILYAIAEVEEVHLLVLGFTKGSIYPQLAEDLGIRERVHFLGFRADMADLMSAADLFVYPSRYEPFALVLLEAMATGTPIITSSTCGAVELLTEDAAIVIKDPDDIVALTHAIQHCVNNRDGLRRMGDHANALAQNHSWDAMARQYISVINEVAVHKAIPIAQ